jgi:hypothetical protein
MSSEVETSRGETMALQRDSSTSLRSAQNDMTMKCLTKTSSSSDAASSTNLAFSRSQLRAAKISRCVPLAWKQFLSSAREAEINPAYKQIIPYALIAFQNKVAYYVRGKKAGEQRLVAKGSIGIGGHMNETDESLFAMDEQAYRAGVEREVNEEIKIDAPFDDRIVALLNDDTHEVGRVHLGIVHVF